MPTRRLGGTRWNAISVLFPEACTAKALKVFRFFFNFLANARDATEPLYVGRQRSLFGREPVQEVEVARRRAENLRASGGGGRPLKFVRGFGEHSKHQRGATRDEKAIFEKRRESTR